MQHSLAVAGAAVGIVGTLALSYDLLKTKSAERSVAEFKHLQDEIEVGSQQLIAGLSSNLATLVSFLGAYLPLLELDMPGSQSSTSAAEVETTHAIRAAVISQFAKAQAHYLPTEQLRTAQALIADGRQRLEKRFIEEIRRSQRMRLVALLGVILVGIGAVLQLADLLYA